MYVHKQRLLDSIRQEMDLHQDIAERYDPDNKNFWIHEAIVGGYHGVEEKLYSGEYDVAIQDTISVDKAMLKRLMEYHLDEKIPENDAECTEYASIETLYHFLFPRFEDELKEDK